MIARKLRRLGALLVVLGVSLGIAACSASKNTDQATEQAPKAPQDIIGAP